MVKEAWKYRNEGYTFSDIIGDSIFNYSQLKILGCPLLGLHSINMLLHMRSDWLLYKNEPMWCSIGKSKNPWLDYWLIFLYRSLFTCLPIEMIPRIQFYHAHQFCFNFYGLRTLHYLQFYINWKEKCKLFF